MLSGFSDDNRVSYNETYLVAHGYKLEPSLEYKVL